MRLFEMELSGLYHVLSCDSLTKYDFGVAIAQQFGFDAGLIIPKSVLDSSLTATRSPNLTLKVDKLTHALGETLPTVSTGIERFYKLYQQGYPQFLQQLST